MGEISLAKRRKVLQKVATTGVDLDCVYAQTLQQGSEWSAEDRTELASPVECQV